MTEVTTTDSESIRESTSNTAAVAADASRKLRWGAYLIALAGLGFVLNGAAIAYRALLEPGFEAGVAHLGGTTYAELAATNHEVAHYIDHLHVNVAGLMIAAGLATVALAWYGARRGQRWAYGTAVAIPVVFLAHSVPVHQTAGFSFDAVAHLGPGLMWVPALFVGAVLGYLGLREVGGDGGLGTAD